MSGKGNVKKQIKDQMYDFLIEPTKEKLRDLLLNETGEKDNIDYKAEWILGDSLSKLMLALGNSGGGIVVFGIKETKEKTNEPVGIEKIIDTANVDDMIKKYIPSSLKYEILNFDYKSSEYTKLINKKFQVLVVEYTPERLPFISLSKSEGIDEDIIYVRRGTKSVKAKANEIEKILNRRIETQYSSTSELNLEQHIKQLVILYGHISKQNKIVTKQGRNPFAAIVGIASLLDDGSEYRYEDNPNYPDEDFEEFIARMINNKKIKIQKVLDLK